MISSPAYDDVTPFSFPDPETLWCPRRGLPDGPFLHEFVSEELKRNW